MKERLSEFDLIARLTAGTPVKEGDLICGVGDDCAVIRGADDRDWLVTTDALLEGAHFSRQWCDPATLGWKSLAVNMSDIAAMGGWPRFYLVALGLPGDFSAQDAEMIYSGMREMAKESKAILIGGDTMASPSGVVLSITVIGNIPRQRVLYRKGASPGDVIYVTGALGGSALGLACLKKGRCGDLADRFIRRHLHPRPRLEAGQKLASSGMVTAMIDISDGLLSDLGHIAQESSVGFELQAPLVPLEETLDELAPKLGEQALTLALSGGEDYELLFTVRTDRADEFETGLKTELECGATRIGIVVTDVGTQVVLDGKGNVIKLECKGFEHFRER